MLPYFGTFLCILGLSFFVLWRFILVLSREDAVHVSNFLTRAKTIQLRFEQTEGQAAVELALADGNPVAAVRIYQRLNRVSVFEAKRAVDKLLAFRSEPLT